MKRVSLWKYLMIPTVLVSNLRPMVVLNIFIAVVPGFYQDARTEVDQWAEDEATSPTTA